jgi:hypothetical protein
VELATLLTVVERNLREASDRSALRYVICLESRVAQRGSNVDVFYHLPQK